MGSRSGGSWPTEPFRGVGFIYEREIEEGSVLAIGTDPLSKVNLFALGELSVNLQLALVAHTRDQTPA